jgi:hypothetical protein
LAKKQERKIFFLLLIGQNAFTNSLTAGWTLKGRRAIAIFYKTLSIVKWNTEYSGIEQREEGEMDMRMVYIGPGFYYCRCCMLC